MKLEVVARIKTDFKTKFGIPRQSGLVPMLKGKIVFEPAYRNIEALRGLDGYSHLWLIWDFSMAHKDTWSPTVRPPRLGGNARMGVWATRSPFRPNPLGLSSVKIESIQLQSPIGPIIEVSGIDLMDGTPIYDIKPYLAFTDSHPEALGGFAQTQNDTLQPLEVKIDPMWKSVFSSAQLSTLEQVLEADPRPHYHQDPTRIYYMEYAGYELPFKVIDNTLYLLAIK